MLDYFLIDISNTLNFNTSFKHLYQFLIGEKFKNQIKISGKITNVFPSGKEGFIKSENGQIIAFKKNSFSHSVSNLFELLNKEVTFYCEKVSYSKKLIAHQVELKSKITNQIIVPGTQKKGIIKSIAPFGIFVSLDKLPDGLIHRSKLQEKELAMKVGDAIQVIIQKQTPKGLELDVLKE